ncbi:MAG: hypothetical protein FD123_2097 [Bacteroidetes bacterium]|nr:MAG: hypothetical protein FD123_2097 [Bacteroidota bacterium]
MMRTPVKIILAVILAAAVAACSANAESTRTEESTMQCWSKNWTGKDEKTLSAGINALEEYLLAKGLLKERNMPAYMTFAADSTKIRIPKSTPHQEEIYLALTGNLPGAPDVGAMGKCFETNWFSQLSNLDSTDVVARTGRLIKALADAGAVDTKAVRVGFFKGMTESDMQRPLIKAVFYFFACDVTRFKFE